MVYCSLWNKRWHVSLDRFHVLWAKIVVGALRSPNALEFSLALYAVLWGTTLAYADGRAATLVAASSALGGADVLATPFSVFGAVGVAALLCGWRKGRACSSLLLSMSWGYVGGLFWLSVPPISSAYLTYWCFAVAELVVFIRVWHGLDGFSIKDH